MTSDPQKNAFDLDYSSRERQFPEGFKRKIVADLQEGMPQFDVLQYFGNQPDIFETYDHLVLATDPEGERIIGILGAKDFVRGSTRFLYLWTAMVVDRYHRTSLFKRINQFFLRQVSERNGGLPPLIVAKTYNPVVYNMFRALSARIPGATLYPDLEAPRQSPDMVDLALDVVGTLSANLRLDAETGLIPGGQRSVAPDFFPRMAMSSHARTNDHFVAHVGSSDQILCMVRLAPGAEPYVQQRIIRGADSRSAPTTRGWRRCRPRCSTAPGRPMPTRTAAWPGWASPPCSRAPRVSWRRASACTCCNVSAAATALRNARRPCWWCSC